MLKAFDWRYYICLILLCPFSSCRKAKQEGHSYNFHYSAINYPAGGWHDQKLLIKNFNRHEIEVQNFTGSNFPINKLTIKNKKISGYFLLLSVTSIAPGVDTFYYELEGNVTNKRISGSYKEIPPSHITLPGSYGPFEIDLTKPIE